MPQVINVGPGALLGQALITTAETPVMGRISPYDASAGPLAPVLHQASTRTLGATCLIKKVDASSNPVTVTCYSGETFTDSTTTRTLTDPGDFIVLEVASEDTDDLGQPIGVAQWEVISAGSSTSTSAPAAVLRPRRNTIAAIGDSITALGSEGWYQPWLGHTWINLLQVMSHQRIRYGAGNFSIAGTPIANQTTVQLPQVLAMNPLPGACVLAVATNDIQSTGWDFTAEKTALKQSVAKLLAVGVTPILWCPPPNNHVGTVTVADIHARTYQWNAWIRRYAAANGYALVDAHSALTQLDGTAISGTVGVSPDLIHPTGYGHRLIAEQALADGLADIFPPNSLVNTARSTDDLSNMLNNGTINQGLFTVDTNSDGVADGLSGSGSGTHTFSLVAPAPADELQGNWQQSTVSSVSGTSLLAVTFSTGWSVGDVIAFSARVQTSGFETSGGLWLVALKTDTPSGFTTPDGTTGLTFLFNGAYEWDSDIQDGELYVEFTIPSAATDLALWIQIGSVTVATGLTVRVGEVTVRNLTTGGLLV